MQQYKQTLIDRFLDNEEHSSSLVSLRLLCEYTNTDYSEVVQYLSSNPKYTLIKNKMNFYSFVRKANEHPNLSKSDEIIFNMNNFLLYNAILQDKPMNGTYNYAQAYAQKIDPFYKNKTSDNYILPPDYSTTLKPKYKDYLLDQISYVKDNTEFSIAKSEMNIAEDSDEYKELLERQYKKKKMNYYFNFLMKVNKLDSKELTDTQKRSSSASTSMINLDDDDIQVTNVIKSNPKRGSATSIKIDDSVKTEMKVNVESKFEASTTTVKEKLGGTVQKKITDFFKKK